MTNPGSAMTAMTVIPNPLKWTKENKEVLLYYLTNVGQHFVQKRNQGSGDVDPNDTPVQPPGPLASPSQFASLKFQDLVEVYGMVQSTVQSKGGCGCTGCDCKNCSGKAAAAPTTVLQPYVISPVYRPLLQSKEEATGTDQWALAACGDGNENGWVYYVRSNKSGEPQVHEVPLAWEAAEAINKTKQNPLPGTMLAACYLGDYTGNLDRWIFYVAEDPDQDDDGDDEAPPVLFFFNANDSGVGGKIPDSTGVLKDTPLAACVLPSKDDPKVGMICLYYVKEGNTLVRLTHLTSDTDAGNWTVTPHMGAPPKVANKYAQMGCVVDEDKQKVRLYYHQHGDDAATGWNVYEDKWYHK